ncbi:MAG: toprim domain-containing protein, partial [Rubrivivax sp.]
AGDIGDRRRCKIDGDRERRGWYHLHELRTDAGDTLLVGAYGIWRGDDPGTQKITVRGNPLSTQQREALRARILADQKRAAGLRAAQAQRASQRAAAMWARLSPLGDSDYLERKGVIGHGVRYSPTGALIIPMLDVGGVVHGLQVIYPTGSDKAKRLGRDKDFWPAGLAKVGRMFTIGSPAASSILLLCEGYATGASLYEATGLPVAVAFDAGNLLSVAQALVQRHRGLRVLVCADDDYLAKCPACKGYTLAAEPACRHCGVAHERSNTGITAASTVALAVGGAWCAPRFAADRPLDHKGPTDFNDLHQTEGLHVVRAQVEGQLSALGWRQQAAAVAASAALPTAQGGGVRDDLKPIEDVSQLLQRFALVYEMPETVFDCDEHKLVPLSSMRNLCTSRQLHRAWMESPAKRIVRATEVGFDPGERDAAVKCNLWGGWPTT